MEFNHATVFYKCVGLDLENTFENFEEANNFKGFIEEVEGITNVEIMVVCREVE